MSAGYPHVARRLWVYVRPYRPQLAGTLLISLSATPLALLAPLPLKIAVDSILGAQPLPGFLRETLNVFGVGSSPIASLITVAVLMVAITVLIYIQGLSAWIWLTWLGEKLVLDLRAGLLSHAQRLSLAYHDRAGTMDSVYRIQYDAQALQSVIVTGLMPLVGAAMTLAGMVIVTAIIDWQLAAVSLAICPVLYWLTGHYGHRLRQRWFEVKDLDSSAMSVVQEVLSAVRVVKAFGREAHEHQRFLSRSGERLSGQMDVARIQGKFDLAIGTTIAAGTAIVLVLGVHHAQLGRLTLGQLLMVMAYLTQIYEPLKTISKKIADLQSGLVSAERAFALLDELPEVHEHDHPKPLVHSRGEFRFDHVSFAYEAGREVIRDLVLHVPPGARVGIQGRTGAGKTTFINLLSRFYDATSGRILLDDVDIREYRLADLRQQFSIVLQEPMLFSTTIAENIAYGRTGATDAEIVQAARDANAHDFIVALPQGYRTQVGERGMRLSGGERQRIAIARAFLKQSAILVLDEPTSAIDVVTETAIVEAMERLMRGRTVFMIAHRLSTLRTCDIRLILDDGRVRVASTTELDHEPAALSPA